MLGGVFKCKKKNYIYTETDRKKRILAAKAHLGLI